MTITFEELTSAHEYADGGAVRHIRSFGFTETSGGAFGYSRRRLRSFGTSVAGALDIPAPEVPAIGVHTRFLRTSGAEKHGNYVDGSHGRSIDMLGFAGDGAGGFHRRKISTFGYPSNENAGYGFLMTMPFFISGFGAHWFENMEEGVALGAGLKNIPVYGVVERLRLRGLVDDTFTGLARAADKIELGDMLLVILRELLSEGFTIGGEATANFKAMTRVMDALAFSGIATSTLEATNIIAVTVAFGELLKSGYVVGVSDEVQLGDALQNALRAGAQLVEGLLLDAPTEASARFGALVSEEMLLGAESSTALEAVELLQEGVSFAIHLTLDDGQYVAYSINTENKAITEYTNYPFNSFCSLPIPGGRRYFGMMPDGIRELEGEDDAGSPIAARFRLAISNLGNGQLKRMQAAYLGYTSTGELRIKAIVVAKDGMKEAHYYRLHAQPVAAPEQSRIKIGQGLRAVYWGFEVEAIDGAAFMIDLLDLHPLAMSDIGRIQGEGGGNR